MIAKSYSTVFTSLAIVGIIQSISAFSTPSSHVAFSTHRSERPTSEKLNGANNERGINVYRNNRRFELHMSSKLDIVTYLRTEWVSAALCTNQIPAASKSVLQIGTEDGRAVNFVPRTVDELITSSAEEDGIVSISCRRQLKQQKERRGTGITLTYVDQAADDLKEVKDDSVDVVISLQAADRMRENGMDWKKSLKETARVLKPGGRLLFVEKAEIEGSNYVDEVMTTTCEPKNKNGKNSAKKSDEVSEESNTQEDEVYPTFEMVGYDMVDLVIVPHVAGVVVKTMYSGMTASDIEAQKALDSKAKIAELSITAFERGLKKRKKKKKKKSVDTEEMES